MKPVEFIRTALFVPGNRPDRVDKAVATAAKESGVARRTPKHEEGLE